MLWANYPRDWFRVNIRVWRIDGGFQWSVVVKRPVLGGWVWKRIGEASSRISTEPAAFEVASSAARSIMNGYLGKTSIAKVG